MKIVFNAPSLTVLAISDYEERVDGDDPPEVHMGARATLTASEANEVATLLRSAGRHDLAKKVAPNAPDDMLSSFAAAQLLGVSSRNTVKNWLEGGHFPGAFKTPGGHWRFPRHEVEAMRSHMEALRQRNASGDLSLPDDDVDYPEPPLL